MIAKKITTRAPGGAMTTTGALVETAPDAGHRAVPDKGPTAVIATDASAEIDPTRQTTAADTGTAATDTVIRDTKIKDAHPEDTAMHDPAPAPTPHEDRPALRVR